MVEFVEKFDFLASVSPHLQQTDTLSMQEIDPRVVGCERNGILLYTWYNKQTRRPSAWKTLVSVYDTNRHESKIVFSHNDKIDIVDASINQTLIILAFTVRERQLNIGEVGSKEQVDIFKSYIAEIAPQKRVFSLNIEWHTYQKVQFLYHANTYVKEIYMLFIHHKESIGLYCIPVAKLGDDGFVMSSQPKTDQIVRQFLWSKFDPMEQRLFFIQLRADDEEQVDGALTFNAIQFDDRGKYRYILNFQLPVSFKMEMMREKVRYYNRYLSQSVSNMNLNIETVTSNKGALMICYQHQQEVTSDNGNITPKPEDDSLSICSSIQGSYKVSYTIFCVHAGYSINCSVSLNEEIAIKSQILFTMFGDYLLVLLPGHFLHLLDCGSEHEPVHHIFLSEVNCPMGPAISTQGTLLSTATWDFVPSVQHGVLLFENLSQKSYKVSFNHKLLIKTFSTSRHATTRLAILHAAIVHVKDLSLSKKLIECLCQDPANLECSELISEYLIASSYAHMKQQLSYAFLRPFPFTCLDLFRGQVERDRENQRAVFLTYKRFNKDLVDALLYLLKGKESEYWISLKQSLKISQDTNVKRFPFKSLSHLVTNQIPRAHQTATREVKMRQSGSALATDGARKGSSDHSTQKDRGPGRNDDSKIGDDPISFMIIESVSMHILKCFPRESKNRVQNICVEYAACRGKVVRSLWRHLTKVLGYAHENEVYKQPLEKTSKATDFALFQMLERLYSNVNQLSFPQFRGMPNVFVALGYRCLPNHLFRQYFRASVFEASPEFIQRFVIEVPENDESSSLKLDLISSLPKNFAKPIIADWDHPVARRFITQELVGKFNTVGIFHAGSAIMADAAERGQESNRFLPMETFLRSIRLEENSRNFASYRLTEDEWQYLVDTAQINLNNVTLKD